MMKAHLHLIKYAIARGHYVSVWDGEEWAVKKKQWFKTCKDACEAVEEGTIKIWETDAPVKENKSLGWFAFMFDRDQQPEEIIYDYGVCDWADQWWNDYMAGKDPQIVEPA